MKLVSTKARKVPIIATSPHLGDREVDRWWILGGGSVFVLGVLGWILSGLRRRA